jgi:YegS/Rv2252/BmrU family lipid kinase
VSRRFAVLVNPAAAGGKALRVIPDVERELRRLGADYRVVQSSSGDHAKVLARQMADAGEVAIAVGGDGLVGTLAGALCGSESALAIIPAGRGNDFARVLGIPSDPAAAARLAVEGTARAVDVGEVDGKTFVGIASFGIDSDVNRIANDTKLFRGSLVYAIAMLRTLAPWKHAHFTYVVDGQRREMTGYSVAVANSGVFGGGMRMAPDAEIDDGLLDVVAIEGQSKWQYLRGLPRVFKGTHVQNPAVRIERGRRVEVDADRPFTIYADGDPLGELPATITVAERALLVIAP